MEELRLTVEEARGFLDQGCVGVAEILGRRLVQKNPGDTAALKLMAEVAGIVGEHWWKSEYERRAGGQSAAVAPGPVPSSGPEKFLLIKGWGNGFCSDLDHTLGHLLLAEMTGRTPIIHWGRNSLFGTDPEQDAFGLFFERPSKLTIDDLVGKGFDFFPPKWHEGNLRRENLNKISGDWSRLPPIVYLNRPERVCVADIYAGVANLVAWIRPEHPLHGKGVAEVYRYLVQKYVKPLADIREEVDAFAAAYLSQGPIIAVHIRGSDKHKEDPQLAQKHAVYPRAIAQLSAGLWFPKIFLLTDSAPIREEYAGRYGTGLITTDCVRSPGSDGVHLSPQSDRRRIGIEVLKDVLLAAKCEFFVGLGSSNVTCMVHHMKPWPQKNILVIGPLMTQQDNPYLYMTVDQLARFLPADMIGRLRERARKEQEALTA